MDILKNNAEHLILGESLFSLSSLMFMLIPGAMISFFMSLGIWGMFSINILDCKQSESKQPNCTLQKFNALGWMYEEHRLVNLQSSETEEEYEDRTKSIYHVFLQSQTQKVLFHSSWNSELARGISNSIQEAIKNQQPSFHFEKIPKDQPDDPSGGLTGVAFLSPFFVLFVILPIFFFFSRKSHNYQFQRAFKVLRVHVFSHLRTIVDRKIPFSSIERVEIVENKTLGKDEDDRKYANIEFKLFLHLHNGEFFHLIASNLVRVYQDNETTEHEVGRRYNEMVVLAQCITEMTGAPHNQLTSYHNVPNQSALATKPTPLSHTKTNSNAPTNQTVLATKPVLSPHLQKNNTTKTTQIPRFRFIRTLFILIFIVVIFLSWKSFSPDEPTQDGYSPWMSLDEYQEEFDRQVKNKFYPSQVKGRRNNNGELECQALFVKFPPTKFYFYSHCGLSEANYIEKHKEYTSKGFTITWHQELPTPSGEIFHQITWVRK
jgi:hypothetical protein